MTILKTQNRIDYVDLLRSFGIILMVMGHVRFGGYFDKWIHAFHMPIFFFISGWFYKSRGRTRTQIVKKIKQLIFPYVVFELLQLIVLMIFIPEYRSIQVLFYIFVENTYKIPIDSRSFDISPIPGAMWFLTALFLAESIYIFLDKAFRNNWKLHISVLILTIIGMSLPNILPFRLPWALDVAFVGMGFFHIARICKGSRFEEVLNLKPLQTLIAGIVICILIMICPKVNMRTGNYGWYLPFWINAIGAIVIGWNMSRYLEQILMRGRFRQIVFVWLKSIGKNSIVYLCLNQTVILTTAVIMENIGMADIIKKILVLIVTMAILFLLEEVICRTKLKALIAR